ncbi:MAG: hypothetical protein IJQ07_06535 [Clostridia bacterium]|nr:hypothetical protein [Clostridia bacterium]
MFKINDVKLIYSYSDVAPTIYSFDKVNYIYGTNNVGKTAMVKAIDFVLAKDDFNLGAYEGLDNVQAIEICLIHDNDYLYLKRSVDNIYSYKKSSGSMFVETSSELYKKELTYFINRGDNRYLEDFYQYADEHLTCRAFSFLNFLNEKDLGNISNLFLSTDTYYNQTRIRKLISFIFNYKNIKRISELEKENENFEQEIKMHADQVARYNYFISLIKNNMLDLQLDSTGSLEENKKAFIKFKENFLRDKDNSKTSNSDLAVLMRISCALAEEIKYQRSLEQQSQKLKSRNERSNKLLGAFKEILEYDGSYAKYLEEINSILEKQAQENDILSVKDFTRTIDAIEAKKYKIDKQIKECSVGLNRFEYGEILKKIGVIEQYFSEISKIANINEIKNYEEKVNENKKEIKRLNKEFADTLVNEFNHWINDVYAKLQDIKFSEEDSNISGFKIKFNPIAVSISGEKNINKGDKKEVVSYYPGSNARMTTWQILAYLGLFKVVNEHFQGFPLMQFIFIDGLNQPFDDTETCYPNVCELLKNISKDLGVQLFIVSTRNLKIGDDGEKFVDLSNGFNKMHNKRN